MIHLSVAVFFWGMAFLAGFLLGALELDDRKEDDDE